MLWTLDGGEKILLLTPDELRNLPGNCRIISIMGNERLVDEPGLGLPDIDTRAGCTAWGIAPTQPGVVRKVVKSLLPKN